MTGEQPFLGNRHSGHEKSGLGISMCNFVGEKCQQKLTLTTIVE